MKSQNITGPLWVVDEEATQTEKTARRHADKATAVKAQHLGEIIELVLFLRKNKMNENPTPNQNNKVGTNPKGVLLSL